EGKGRVGGDVDAMRRDATRLQELPRRLIPHPDAAGAPQDGAYSPPQPAPPEGTDSLAVNVHRLPGRRRKGNHGQIIEGRAGARPVLEEPSSPADHKVGAAKSFPDGSKAVPVDGFDAVQRPRFPRVAAQDRDLDGAGAAECGDEPPQHSFVTRVAKTVITRHHDAHALTRSSTSLAS